MMNKLLLVERVHILSAVVLSFGLFCQLSCGVEDVRSREYVLRGFIKSGSKKGDEVELVSSLGTIYGKKLTLGIGRDSSGGKICGYTIYDNKWSLFKVVNVDKETGDASLILNKDLDGGKRNYTIEVAPHTCSSGRHLEKIWIFIQVIEPYKWKPQWKQPSYSIEAVESEFYSSLFKVEVEEDYEVDGIKGHGKVCQFKVVTKGVPFEIDETGVVKNLEPLDFSKKEKWEFDVVAESCEKRPSDPVKVVVKVKPSCQAEWIGIPERVEFSPHDGKKLLAPEAELDLCDNNCNITSTTVSIKLSTAHIGKGCDRDTYSLHSQRKLCGASSEAVDLLPNPAAPSSWTRNIPTDDGKESDEVFAFDGKKDAVEVSKEVNKINLGQEFTIATWMKHDEMEEQDDGSVSRKENILCMSDSEEMNRQHMALFLRRCRLVLLLHQEPDSGLERDAYAPAEWRWTLPEVCDGKWHHYAISISNQDTSETETETAHPTNKPTPPSPKAKLYIDGKEFVPTRKNPDVVDDFPLHATKNIHSTKMVVGGCWMGGMGRIGHHFKGYLAGLSLLNHQNEPSNVIQCLTKCQEKLDFTAVDEMDTGMTVSMNSEMTSISIGGPSLSQVENLLRKVGYVNSRNFPTPGHRPITFETRAVCKDGKQVDVEAVKTLLTVNSLEKPLIVLKGATYFEEEAKHLIRGVFIFKGLDISTHSKSQADEVYYRVDGKKPDFMSKYNLDSCSIKMNIPLAPPFEHLKISEAYVKRLGLKVESSANGLVVSGVDKLESYQEVISGIKYFNNRPSDLNQRSFTLVCSELNGRYISNQLEVSMGVVHKLEEKAPEPQAANVHRLVQPVGSIQPSIDRGQPHMKTIIADQSSGGSATGVVIVCIVCIGFIVLLAAVGVSRIRNAQRHSRDAGVDDKQEMEWDNSALTITVNPMDQEGLYDDETSLVSVLNNNNNNNNNTDDDENNTINHHHHRRRHHDDDDTDVDDDDASCHDSSCIDDEEEEEEEVQCKVKKGELEWDDSTLTY